MKRVNSTTRTCFSRLIMGTNWVKCHFQAASSMSTKTTYVCQCWFEVLPFPQARSFRRLQASLTLLQPSSSSREGTLQNWISWMVRRLSLCCCVVTHSFHGTAICTSLSIGHKG
eukprot:PhF_6_TR38168/c0_g1_i1/m.57024